MGVNSSFAAFFDKVPEDLLGKTDQELQTQDEQTQLNHVLERKILESKEPYQVREVLKPLGGTAMPVISKKSVVIEEAGTYLVSFSIIEEDLLKEHTHVKTHHNLQILDQLAEVFICWKDDSSTFKGCNQNFADLVGKTKEEIIGKKDTINEKHIKDDISVRESGKAKIQYEETIPDKEGNIIRIRTNKDVWKDAEGHVIGTAVIFNKTTLNSYL